MGKPEWTFRSTQCFWIDLDSQRSLKPSTEHFHVSFSQVFLISTFVKIKNLILVLNTINWTPSSTWLSPVSPLMSIFCCCCSVTWSCPTLCNPMDCSTPGVPVLHHLPELAQTHVYWISDAIQPSHPLSSLSPPALNLSQDQGLFHWVASLHQVAKVPGSNSEYHIIFSHYFFLIFLNLYSERVSQSFLIFHGLDCFFEECC